ncbi:MAG: two-component sensor histidine kinase [Gammaproteobacteria bacterium CG_4_10_14_0_8_um_filter_38_16]|nr:MAG: two-component sensor histidine kinase [Gammaproteobacteria bacterium CG_4_10_14_0_8_um_filter_38_16]PJA03038.1 MAG: two-component sensor histidine kinase [Gammaproteobacteria bacterium CG_4_10_14_0_2_um_filter_38_22]PJB10232.1 MAG: two-component sensor histidine kinase [Gammaproteobacteria bacterium CG_4_9_14_3_um_filter_38_9]
MAPSIRTYLLINLLLSVTLITSLAIIGNLFLAHQDIQLQLDAELIRTTLRMEAIFSGPINTKELALIQKHLENENTYLKELKSIPNLKSDAIQQASKNLEFQIWDKKGKLILHSKNALKTPFSSGTEGLSTLWLQGHTWRVSTGYNHDNHLTIMLAERANFRQELEDRLTQDSIVVMLVTYPFLGFLIWVIVGRGLDSLRRVAKEVHQRAPTYLEAVDLESVPTEIEPLVSELNSLFHRLEAAFEREKRFTADAAHELKTPLAALSTQTQVALRAKTDEEKKEALLKVLFGVKRSTHVVQQLLTLSRMEPEAGLTDTTSVNLSKQAIEVISMLAPAAIEKNIELELLSPDCTALIKGNITAIDILIRNLVDNAIRYSPPDSFVTIDIREDAKHVTLIVSDNGVGIPEKLRKRVFERFFRVVGNQALGSGLGLSIVQQIAKLHHAEIQLHTPESGRGAEFRVIFPREK